MPTDMGIFPVAKGHLRRRETGIDQAIFIYCVKGAGWCEVGGKRRDISRGELLVVPPGQPHAYGSSKNQSWTIYWFHLTGDHVLLYLKWLGVTVDHPVLTLGDDAQALALLDDMIETLEHGYGRVNLLCASLTMGHLMGALIYHRQDLRSVVQDAAGKISRSTAYMREHLDKPLRLAALASLVNLSRSHYAALFRQQTGYPAIDYFIRLKMQKACQLLDTTSLSVKEIAVSLGYEDPFYFSRIFKSIVYLAPRQYREIRKG